MGSFNVACAISGLPCTPGDPVYAILLTRNAHYDNRDVYPNSVWVPRTPAMAGTYDDYGRVAFSDDPTEKVLQRLACSMLDLESVEAAGSLGRGGHVRHGMGLLAYLEAIEEGTLVVSCAADRDMRKMAVDFVAKHAAPAPPEPMVGPIPTIGSVVAVLEAGGFKANDPATTCFFVSEIEKGEIVVNCESWGGLKIEEAATVLAKTYAAVLARARARGRSGGEGLPQAQGRWLGRPGAQVDPGRTAGGCPGHHQDGRLARSARAPRDDLARGRRDHASSLRRGRTSLPQVLARLRRRVRRPR